MFNIIIIYDIKSYIVFHFLQEGIIAYKVINSTYLLNDFLNHGDDRHQIQFRNIGDLGIPLYAATQS